MEHKPLTHSDDAFLTVFEGSYGGSFLYCKEEQQFYRFDGELWTAHLADEHLQKALINTADKIHDAADGDAEQRWARGFQNGDKLTRVTNMLRRRMGWTISATEFDADRCLIPLQDSVLDLRLDPLDRLDNEEDMSDLEHLRFNRMISYWSELHLTHKIDATFYPGVECPRWEEFTARWMPDPTVRRYFQRAIGYALCGGGDEKAIFLIHGPGNTGKSTCVASIAKLFGRLAVDLPPSAITLSKFPDPHRRALVGLRGASLAVASELPKGAVLDTATLKALSGGDQITTEAKYQHPISFRNRAVLFLVANDLPEIQEFGSQVWDRVRPIRFPNAWAPDDAERIPREELDDIIWSERDGILWWIVEGYLDYRSARYRHDGYGNMVRTDALALPESMRLDLAEYQQNQLDDSDQGEVRRFIEERLTVSPDQHVSCNDLRDMYRISGGRLTVRAFNKIMRDDLGYRTSQPLDPNTGRQVRAWQGLGLAPASTLEADFKDIAERLAS